MATMQEVTHRMLGEHINKLRGVHQQLHRVMVKQIDIGKIDTMNPMNT